jgi:hypothetical protein
VIYPVGPDLACTCRFASDIDCEECNERYNDEDLPERFIYHDVRKLFPIPS